MFTIGQSSSENAVRPAEEAEYCRQVLRHEKTRGICHRERQYLYMKYGCSWLAALITQAVAISPFKNTKKVNIVGEQVVQ